ncbi:glucose-6-phosphate isomerase [Aliikangiella marina]|uniref:Glucose-6-phosphate isomerase n=1 Tax=Aliikangiella marina TaxID=1712262 RepID=A0A545T995_9GAMM|nr:glucose-6-phosphate isomerase [Aliikangiella marina]TQV73791.1 glucose-6-phosphate isomerase [Aliikangiella marina]
MQLTQFSSWKALTSHYQSAKHLHIRDLFESDPLRQTRFSVLFEDILFDYSKNRISPHTFNLLTDLAKEVELKSWIERMFSGDKLNHTEGRAVLHTALRLPRHKPLVVGDQNISSLVHRELDKMSEFCYQVRSGRWLGYTGKPVTDIVNIGIGGSDLGPQLVVEALKSFSDKPLKCHFVSNVDTMHLLEKTENLNLETTLFIVASKSFTTDETMTNAESLREWFLKTTGAYDSLGKHFVAVSSNQAKAISFGINPENIFNFWDWVGGRYSLWSSIGLSIALTIGIENFKEMLAGAHAMDEHFRTAPFEKNIPVIMALLGIWYNNFFGCESHAILPYDHQLNLLPAYLEQADMESNGKSVDRDGKQVNYSTGGIVWGSQGINGQHAFYQLIHQGTKLVPADFISSAIPHESINNHHNLMLSNFFAQTEALMKGRTREETLNDLRELGLTDTEIEKQLPHMTFEGNKPTNSILLKKITPRSLGSLLAMYEHKVFTQGVIWNINSFDQYGVELGKKLAKKILSELNDTCLSRLHDGSTQSLMTYFRMLTAQPKLNS